MRRLAVTTFALAVALIAGARAFQSDPFAPPPGTRTDVAIAITKMGYPDPAQRLAGVRKIAALPADVGAPAVRALVALLADPATVVEGVDSIMVSVAEEAAKALSYLGRYAADAVIEALHSPHDQVRIRAVKALGRMENTPRADDAVVQVMQSAKDEFLRTLAAIHRAEHRDERALPVLSAAVLDPNSTQRGDAASALATLGNPAGAKPILAALNMLTGSGQLETQPQAEFAAALGALRAPESEEPLAALTRHPSDSVRRAAITALGRVARKMRPELIEALRYPVGPTSEWAARSLSEIRDPASVPVVAGMLERSVPGWIVSIALAPFGSDALDAVAQRFHHTDDNVRQHALIVLSSMIAYHPPAVAEKYERMVLPLIAKDSSIEVRRAAVDVLMRSPGFSDDAINVLIGALDDASLAQRVIRLLQTKTKLYRLTTAGEFRRWRAAELERRAATERFWNRQINVTGKVVHPDGRPAVGLLVVLVQLGEDESISVWPIQEALSTRTGPDGSFAITVQPVKGVIGPDRDFIFVGWVDKKYRFLGRNGAVARNRFALDASFLDAGTLTIYPTLHPPGAE